jgi:hypothetical protein
MFSNCRPPHPGEQCSKGSSSSFRSFVLVLQPDSQFSSLPRSRSCATLGTSIGATLVQVPLQSSLCDKYLFIPTCATLQLCLVNTPGVQPYSLLPLDVVCIVILPIQRALRDMQRYLRAVRRLEAGNALRLHCPLQSWGDLRV